MFHVQDATEKEKKRRYRTITKAAGKGRGTLPDPAQKYTSTYTLLVRAKRGEKIIVYGL